MQQKSQKKAELLDNEKPAAVVGPITTDKFVKIYITLTGVHQVPPENVQVHFTERLIILEMGASVNFVVMQHMSRKRVA
uniref:CS domain-containing protein n=1 Tax=Nomascus leucogenys TaxID=61853 RepID=A0A2I3GJ67_NOMLE